MSDSGAGQLRSNVSDTAVCYCLDRFTCIGNANDAALHGESRPACIHPSGTLLMLCYSSHARGKNLSCQIAVLLKDAVGLEGLPRQVRDLAAQHAGILHAKAYL